MHRPAAFAAMLMASIVSAQAQSPSPLIFQTEPAGAHATIVWSTAFLKEGTPSWQEITLHSLFLDSQLASLLPVVPGRFGMVFIQCTGIGSDGRLHSCQSIRAEPANLGYEKAATALKEQLAADPAIATALAPKLRFIDLEIMMWNSEQGQFQGPCWAPRCNSEPGILRSPLAGR
jgi:hypothetical protein